MKLKAIIRNINWLNILLMVAIALFANYILLPIFDIKASYMPPSVKKGSEEKKQEVSQEVQIPTPLEYAVIADQNLFHPERKIPIEKVEQQPLPKPEFVLYGTLITDELSIAYLEDLKAPFTTPGRGKRQRAIRTGDSMSGFTLKEIETDKIVMVRGEEKLIVAMIDSNHPKERKEAGTATAPKQPQATPAPTPAQKQIESRRATSVSQAPATPRASLPRAAQSAPAGTPSTSPTRPGMGIKAAPQNVERSVPQVDPNNITPGGFLYDKLHR